VGAPYRGSCGHFQDRCRPGQVRAAFWTKIAGFVLDEFRELQWQARKKGLGLWSAYCGKNQLSWLSKNLSASMEAMQPVKTYNDVGSPDLTMHIKKSIYVQKEV